MLNERGNHNYFSPFSKGEIERGLSETAPDSFFSEKYARRHLPSLLAWAGGLVTVAVIAVALLFFGWWRAPVEFPVGALVTVREGMTIGATTELLKSAQAIRSPFWFRAWSILLGGRKGLKAGDYYLKTPISAVELARRLTRGIQELVPVRVTIPEGLSNKEVSALLTKSLPRFGSQRFVERAKGKEGYLFPDTYTFFPNITEARVITGMEENFNKRVGPLESDIKKFGRSLGEVITMASLLEEEARTDATRQRIAGILWKRLEKKVPLQVDAVFPYIFGDKPYDLTDGDLLVDSPYNTYKYIGLPPTPISNPGLAAIRAAITPITTPYWFYLSDRGGNMHYAVTHDEHLANRAKYLGK